MITNGEKKKAGSLQAAEKAAGILCVCVCVCVKGGEESSLRTPSTEMKCPSSIAYSCVFLLVCKASKETGKRTPSPSTIDRLFFFLSLLFKDEVFD